MGDLYRSQDMSLIRIFMPTDTAKSVLNELGKLDVIHFRDVKNFLLKLTINLSNIHIK